MDIYSFILLFYLYLGSALNHVNPYTDKCRFDFIDIFDRVLLVCVICYFIYYYHSNLSLWFALLYLIVCYFFIMPYCCIQNRIIIHCSFHFVTAITAIYLLSI